MTPDPIDYRPRFPRVPFDRDPGFVQPVEQAVPDAVGPISLSDPPDYGGAFDGFTVTSDTDPGL